MMFSDRQDPRWRLETRCRFRIDVLQGNIGFSTSLQRQLSITSEVYCAVDKELHVAKRFARINRSKPYKKKERLLIGIVTIRHRQ